MIAGTPATSPGPTHERIPKTSPGVALPSVGGGAGGTDRMAGVGGIARFGGTCCAEGALVETATGDPQFAQTDAPSGTLAPHTEHNIFEILLLSSLAAATIGTLPQL